jgi:hypothetical protein
MSMTAQQLITRSWYLSGIVARNAQTVSGDQNTDGLILLNALLDFKTIETDLIPYWTYYEFDAVAGQEAYFLENVYEIESATFNIDVVRYPMDYVSRRTYFGSSRVDNIETLPFNWTFNREVGGGTFYMYFLPQSNYPVKIMAKFGLQNVSLNTDMTEVYDPAYVEYLRYALAEYMCSEYGILFNPESQQILKSMKRTLMYISPPDLSMIKSSVLTQCSGINFGDVNIGKGWRPN